MMNRQLEKYGLIIRCIVACIIIILCSSYLISGEKTGTTSAGFLKISPLPKIAAMGNSFSSMAIGAGSMAYNPAGLTGKYDYDMLISHTKWFAGISGKFMGIAYNSGIGFLGLSMISLGTDDMEITTPEHFSGTGEYFRSSEYAFGLTYANNFTDKLSLGATFKVIKSFLMNDNLSSSGLVFDIGTIYNISENYSFGIALKNLGPDIKYINESYSLPASLSAGISGTNYFFTDHNILWAFQGLRYSDSDEKYSVGIEYGYKNTFFIRTGFQFEIGEEYGNTTEIFSGGIGFNYSVSGILCKLDYSYSNYKWLPAVHRLSIQIGL